MDWGLLSEMDKAEPVPIVVLDFYNRSGYPSGAISREMADSLALALEATGEFAVVDRDQVNVAMKQFNFNVPLSYDGQSLLADRLNVPYVITGEIEHITRQSTKEGTYVEVVMNALVVSRITRRPINGARITQKSSPKLGYVTNNLDPLVQEAVSTGAYKLTRAIQDNRMPVATVLNPTSNGILRIRGGSLIGVREGMKLVAVRQQSVTGILRADKVTPVETTCTVIEDFRGVAPSDKVVPFFSLEPIMQGPKQLRDKAVMKLLPWAAAGLLVAFIGSTNNSSDAATIQATPLADASPLGYGDGANRITWQKQSKEVLKYIVYRVVGNAPVAIGVVDGSQHWYIDGAWKREVVTRIDEETNETIMTWVGWGKEYTISIDENQSGPVITDDSLELTEETWEWTWDNLEGTLTKDARPASVDTWSVDGAGSAEMTVSCADIPLEPGETAAYCVQPIYYTWFPSGGGGGGGDGGSNAGIEYSLRLGDMSPITRVVTFMAVPVMVTPGEADTVMSGTFTCTAPEYSEGVVQLSSDPFFDAKNTITRPTSPSGSSKLQMAEYSMEDLEKGILKAAVKVYVRMGVRYPVRKSNEEPKAHQMKSYDGYVFSETRVFDMTRSLMVNRMRSPSQIGPVWPGKGAEGRKSGKAESTTGRIRRERLLTR